MCGIVGFAKSDCLKDTLDALQLLEYRGYDSAGVAYLGDGEIEVVKRKGSIEGLRHKVGRKKTDLTIAHTRWATHGKVSTINAHPHAYGDWAIVHNGIVTNYASLRADLERRGHVFRSTTDSEVIAHLLQEGGKKGDALAAIRYTMGRIEGSYAVAALCRYSPNRVYLFKKGNPLVVGKGEGFGCFASDTPALVAYTHRVYKMQDGEIAAVGKREILFWREGETEGGRRTFGTTSLTLSNVTKGDYATYMQKEIDEIPSTADRTYRAYETPPIGWKGAEMERWILVGCGTAYHAALLGASLCKGEAIVASEFDADAMQVDDKTGVIAISQSGETADTLKAALDAKSKGWYLVAVTNVPGSSLTHLADEVLLTLSGAEIGVAATKSYTTQLAILARIAEWLGYRQPTPSPLVPLTSVLSSSATLAEVAKRRWSTIFLLGKGRDYVTCLEGGLKLKEIAYLHCEVCYAGEIKHGPLALVTRKTLVVVVCTDEEALQADLCALSEVRSRGATVAVISPFEELCRAGDHAVRLPDGKGWEQAVGIVPLQQLALWSALYKGLDPDRPRNLAKSVTVK